MEYGLIGGKLGHSYSKEIHEAIADYRYDLVEMPPETLGAFFEARAFRALNVTIPYKESVIPFLDEISEKALAIGAVNTVLNRNGKLYGYNTDYSGFLYSLKKNDVEIAGKKVLVIGNGGAAQAVNAALSSLSPSLTGMNAHPHHTHGSLFHRSLRSRPVPSGAEHLRTPPCPPRRSAW